MALASFHTVAPGYKPGATTVSGFQFISVQFPDDAKDQTKRRVARSHAMRRALQHKRELMRESSDNFVMTTFEDIPKKSDVTKKARRRQVVGMSLFSVSAGLLDPFQSLAVSSSRLQTLLGNGNHSPVPAPCPHRKESVAQDAANMSGTDKARQSAEPVFTFSEELAFQNFSSVFRTGFVDPAVLSATMLTFTFAVAEGKIDRDCLRYQNQAITCVRERINSVAEATSESTIGTILLLAGVEARLGRTSQVQLHMNAVQKLLETCRSEGVHLTGGIKRAVFWQDLNSSILTNSRRIVDHKTFAELQWSRDVYPPSFFSLPPGFLSRLHLFGPEFIEVLEDVQALQCVRDVGSALASKEEVTEMVQINNHIAHIQSRLAAFARLPPVVECCRLAVHLCSVMLCCTIWCAQTIPTHISALLLRRLQEADKDPVWDDHPDLLLWLLYIGSAFAAKGTIRSQFIALLLSNDTSRLRYLNGSWTVVKNTLEQFIWSNRAFANPVKELWKGLSLDEGLDPRGQLEERCSAQ